MEFQKEGGRPRLSQRFGGSRPGDSVHRLVTNSDTATSLSSLGSYSKARKDRDTGSILNDSSQRVSLCFHQDGENADLYSAHGYPKRTRQGLFSHGLHSSMDDATASQPVYVSAVTGQLHYEGPPEREVHQGDMPQHLYGGLKYGVHQLMHVVWVGSPCHHCLGYIMTIVGYSPY